MEKYELQATKQKSFYGKAIVQEENGVRTLFSYDTKIISVMPDGSLKKYWNGWTATTGKHIKAFCGLNKKEYMALN